MFCEDPEEIGRDILIFAPQDGTFHLTNPTWRYDEQIPAKILQEPLFRQHGLDRKVY